MRNWDDNFEELIILGPENIFGDFKLNFSD